MNIMDKRFKLNYEKIKNDFLQCGSTVKTAELNSCHLVSVHNTLRSFGIKIPEIGVSSRKYKINRDYFSKINTQEKAYWLGFIYADGCILDTDESLKFSMGLTQSDRKHLLKFRKTIDSTHPLQYRSARIYTINGQVCNSKPAYYLKISCAKFAQNLVNLGCVPRKSLVIKFPTIEQVPRKYLRHFIRGIFDGDGSVFVSNEKHWRTDKNNKLLHVRFLGTFDIIKNIARFLNLPDSCVYCRTPSKNTYELAVKRQSRCQNIYDILYKDATVYLKRKKIIFDKNLKKKDVQRS